ncbi:MAG: FAD-dependent 5-carboxymethylaminomethyl-2-thiouridine(34) oxidoreductase MnmC [Gammaproteobacteria bacterium]|nr:FAD-dependent 5-carboxymethylaminomethyl-2-thiouridine(34) oxidoreductase MnmC [Gammaproteobacteria bacterium]
MAEPAIPPWFQPPSPYTSPDRRATVIGAGLAGCSIARHLALRGWQVRLLEKNSAIANLTSGNPAGLVKPRLNYQDNSLNNYYKKYYQYFIDYLENLVELYPDLQQDLSGLFEACPTGQTFRFVENAGWLRPSDFCKAQVAACNSLELRTDQAVSVIEQSAGNWKCLDNNGETIAESPVLILANGDALTAFEETRGLPLEALSGQITLLSADALSPSVQQVHSGKHYLIPLPGGGYLCGASNRRGRSWAVEDKHHQANLRGLGDLLPDISIDARKITAGRTAVRSVSPDHLPLLGAVPDQSFYLQHYDRLHHGRKNDSYVPAGYHTGLYMIGALGSHGIASSPYLGKLLSDIICGSQNGEFDASSACLLHPARFLIRQLRRKPQDRLLHTD